MKLPLPVRLLLLATLARAPLKLTSNFGGNSAFPSDYRGDEDNISPPVSWTGAPKKTQSFVLIMESSTGSSGSSGSSGGSGSGDGGAKPSKTHWLLYDIPSEVTELREELSGAGASDVGRLGMKEDSQQAPVVVDPMGKAFGDGWVDPEVEAMQNMIHSALDASFEDKNRAKEGRRPLASERVRARKCASECGALLSRRTRSRVHRCHLIRRQLLHGPVQDWRDMHLQTVRAEREARAAARRVAR